MKPDNQQQINRFYPIKVWITSIIGGPAAAFLLALLSQDYNMEAEGSISLFRGILVLGFLYSLPLVVIAFFAFRYLLNRNLSPSKIKFTLIVLGFVMFIMCLAIMGLPFHEPETWILPICYSVFFLAGSLFYKIRRNYNP
jgi:hypothetical protein